jgi:ATP-dependent DNA helicase 2 subunit 1
MRATSAPRLVAIRPQLEVWEAGDYAGGQREPPGMWVHVLPYADDIRKLNVPPMAKADAGQIAAARAVISKTTIGEYDPGLFPNPVLHKFHSVVESMALDLPIPDSFPDATLPKEPRILAKAVIL